MSNWFRGSRSKPKDQIEQKLAQCQFCHQYSDISVSTCQTRYGAGYGRASHGNSQEYDTGYGRASHGNSQEYDTGYGRASHGNSHAYDTGYGTSQYGSSNYDSDCYKSDNPMINTNGGYLHKRYVHIRMYTLCILTAT